MNPDAWPTPADGPSREPLPRVEDLPVADQGYDQDSVRTAFDSFYRHAAQLDAALRTLEAVDSFQRQAAALRADLRTLRTSGWTQQPFAAPPSYGFDTRAPREGISPAVWRILGEVVFLIAVSVLLGVAKVHWWVIVGVMAAAFLIIAIIEWAASRERWPATAPASAPGHPVVEAEPASEDEAAADEDAIGWAAFEHAQEPSDAMTMIGAPQEVPAADPERPAAEVPPTVPSAETAPEPEEPEPVVEAEAASAEHEEESEAGDAEAPPVAPADDAEEPHPAPRRRWWRRPEAAEEAASDPAQSPEAPRHVRVLAPDEPVAVDAVDPWEQGFDADEPLEEPEPGSPPDEETGEHDAPLAAESEPPAPRRFRRR